MRDLNASVSWDGLTLGGMRFTLPVSLAEYAEILGQPSRTIDPKPPAPYGHRNNQIHLFDDLGLYLIEHHATTLIVSAIFVLDAAESTFPLATAYTQGIRVGDVLIRPGMRERDYPSGAAIVLERELAGYYSAEQRGIFIGISTKGRPTGAFPFLQLRRRGKVVSCGSTTLAFPSEGLP